MLKQIPLKSEHLFVVATILAFLLCYQLAFKKTIAAWQIHRQLTTQMARANDLSYQPAYMERKSMNLSRVIGLYKADTVTFRSNTISRIAGIGEKENVKLSEVPLQDPLYHTDKFILQKLVFEGSFFAITNVLNQLQNTPDIGLVRAFTYRSIGIKSSNDEARKLVLEVYIEMIK